MPTTYPSPGVYVEEVLSGNAPIAGVGTSTAGFIGIVTTSSGVTPASTRAVGSAAAPIEIGTGTGGTKKSYSLLAGDTPVVTTAGTYKFFINEVEAELDTDAPISNDGTSSSVKFKSAVASGAKITGYYVVQLPTPAAIAPPTEYTLPAAEAGQPNFKSVMAGDVKLCTNFSEFKKFFGDFSNLSGQNTLAHAVFGFFRNGGTRCFVVWVTGTDQVQTALDSFEAIDEIAIVAAPGITNKSVLTAIDTHCRNTGDRFAIFDAPDTTNLESLKPGSDILPGNSDYAAIYFPWIKVFDPASKTEQPVPPSGHIAGIYARVDNQRGVHKAPANEPVLGAVGLTYNISKAKQDGLNPKGINCIRNLNGNIRVWGARTLGGEDNGEFSYISVRRLFNYLRESIDEGTQWSVFEPNSPDLWAKIRRNLTAFLTVVWRSGALFGSTAEQAFYVKCDEETNPPEIRDRGQVVTEIGVAVVKPAEFVIFRISQWSGPSGR